VENARALRRAPEAEQDILVGEEPEDVTTRGMCTDVVAVGDATYCKCIRDAPARLRCTSRPRFDE
jgi:hypothetical protein